MLRTPKKDYEDLKDKAGLIKYAVYLLSRQDYTEAKLLDKLQSYALIVLDADIVLARMLEMKYVCDQRYVESRLRYRMFTSEHGPVRIKQDMKDHGAPQQLITQALESIDNEVWTQNCINLYLKRYPFPSDCMKERNRRTRFLLSRGFTYSDVNIALDSIPESASEGTQSNFLDEDNETY